MTVTHSVSASSSLLKIANWDGESQDIDQALVAAFKADDYLDCIKDLQAQNIDPPSYINNLDKVNLHCSIPKHRDPRFMTIL